MTFFLGCESLSLCLHCVAGSSTYVREADRQVAERLCELALMLVRRLRRMQIVSGLLGDLFTKC
jgi:hypothetical protein